MINFIFSDSGVPFVMGLILLIFFFGIGFVWYFDVLCLDYFEKMITEKKLTANIIKNLIQLMYKVDNVIVITSLVLLDLVVYLLAVTSISHLVGFMIILAVLTWICFAVFYIKSSKILGLISKYK